MERYESVNIMQTLNTLSTINTKQKFYRAKISQIQNPFKNNFWQMSSEI